MRMPLLLVVIEFDLILRTVLNIDIDISISIHSNGNLNRFN